VATLITGFVGGFIAWIVTTVIGEPLRRFFQLRTKAALILAQYDDLPWIENPEAKPPAPEWLLKRSEAYDQIGAELIAFADANTFIARCLLHRSLGKYRCSIRGAGTNLRTLGETYPGTPAWDQIRRQAQRALKIEGWPKDLKPPSLFLLLVAILAIAAWLLRGYL
jgi:hypothetical protein